MRSVSSRTLPNFESNLEKPVERELLAEMFDRNGTPRLAGIEAVARAG